MNVHNPYPRDFAAEHDQGSFPKKETGVGLWMLLHWKIWKLLPRPGEICIKFITLW